MTSIEEQLEALAREVRETKERAELVRVERDEAIREAIEAGMTAYRVAQVTGLGEAHVGRIRRASAAAARGAR